MDLRKWLEIVCVDLNCEIDIESAMRTQGYVFEIPDKGFCGCSVYIDLLGNKICVEQIVYLKEEHRNIKNFKRLLDFIEGVAKKENCKSILVGSSIGYETEKVKRLYKVFGYSNHNLKKEI